MFVLFLDVDGVLNSTAKLRASRNGEAEGLEYVNGMPVGEENREALLALNDPERETYIPDLHVVVHSTWRVDSQGLLSPDFFNDAFDKKFVQGIAPCPPAEKPKAIQQWLDQNGADRFVVLDDHLKLSDNTPHIRVPGQTGFLKEHARALSNFAQDGTEHTKGQFNLVPNQGSVRLKQAKTTNKKDNQKTA